MFNPLFAGHEEAIKLLRQFTQTDFGPVIEIGLGQKTFLDHLLKDGCLNLTAMIYQKRLLHWLRRGMLISVR